MRVPFCLAGLMAGLLSILLIDSPAVAATPVGTTIAASLGATASGPEGSRSLAAGSPVYLGDTIDTGLFGQVEIEFTDRTKLAMGPRSQLVIDDYVARSSGTLNRLGLTAARGAFRFLSGDSAKQAYQLKTPTATIGIRGTEFDYAVGRLASTALALYGGGADVCSLSSGACAGVRDPCEVALIDDGQAVNTETGALTDQAIRLAFPFLRDEGRLSPALRVGSRRCDGGADRQQQRSTGNADHTPPEPQGDDGDGDDGDDGDDGYGDDGTGDDGDGDTGGYGDSSRADKGGEGEGRIR
jgi:hypothetical protein